MRATPNQIDASARSYAAERGYAGISEIPESERAGATATVAEQLGVTRSSVDIVLSLHWMETSGRQGKAVTGGGIAERSSASAYQRDGNIGAYQSRLAPKPENTAPVVERELKGIRAALDSDGAAMISDEQPYSFMPATLRRNVAFDAQFSDKVSTGEYGAIDFSRIADDDPLLDMPLYRGMGSQDPAVHATLLTGRLVPQGRGGDYEGFKRYDHTTALDAYEWTLDPFVALKGTGGQGYLVQTTLRDIKAARDVAPERFDVARKVGDSEGGIFVAGTIQPKMRTVDHRDGRYDLGSTRKPVTNPKAEPFARMLAKRVPEAGGWDEFIEMGGKGSVPLLKAGVHQTREQISALAARVLKLQPNSQLPAKIRARLDSAEDKGLDHAREVSKKCLADLKWRVYELEDAAMST